MKIYISDKVHIYQKKDNVSSDEKPLATLLSEEICNIFPVFHVLTGYDYTNSFQGISKIQNFKKIFLKPVLIALIQFLKVLKSS